MRCSVQQSKSITQSLSIRLLVRSLKTTIQKAQRMRLKRKDGSQVSELFVDHKTEDSHHGGTSVVKLDGTLLHLLFLIKIIPSVIDGSGAEISDEFTSSGVITHDEFQNEDEGEKLDLSSLRDGGQGGGSGRDVGEGCSREINVTRKTDSGVFDEESNNGKHGNTSVLQLGVSELVETFLGNVVEHTKRIEESKWWLYRNRVVNVK